MKLGLDLHGVLDVNPHFFTQLAKTILATGGEVYIITGRENNASLLETLNRLGNGNHWYTDIYSITTELEKRYPYVIDEKGGKSFEKLLWEQAKGIFCYEKKIDMHIDDTESYAKYFKTPIMIYKHRRII